MTSRKIFISVIVDDQNSKMGAEAFRPFRPCITNGVHETTHFDTQTTDIVTVSDLAALHWMRYHVDAEYYGLMHERRRLVFSENWPKQLVFDEGIGKRECKAFGWDDAQIERICEGVDILIPRLSEAEFLGMPSVGLTAYEYYCHQHYASDLDIVEAIVKVLFPEIYPYLVQVLVGRRVFFNNISVMRKSLFQEYTDFIFVTLKEAERQIDTSDYDSYQKRTWGFLAEYLTNAYVHYAKAVHGAKVCERPLASGMRPRPKVLPKTVLAEAREKREAILAVADNDESDINVVLSVDDGYAPHAAVVMLSALRSTAKPDRLKFFILNGGNISTKNRDKLGQLVLAAGGRIGFIDIDDSDLRFLPLNRDYISITTYYRLVMHQYLPADIDKAIYIDADTIVVETLEKLWDIDLEGHPVAGAPDDAGFQQARRLQLSVEHRYFNAGVMVFDIDRLRKMDIAGAVLAAYRKMGPYIVSQDQDLLNILFELDTKTLPLAWNAGTRLYRANPMEPSYSEEEALEAARAPFIVHFTDSRKPWHIKCTHPFTELYWEYRNETPWAETTMERWKRCTFQWLRRQLRTRDRRFERNIADA